MCLGWVQRVNRFVNRRVAVGGKGQGLFPDSCGEAEEKQRGFLGEESSAGQWGGGVCGGGG